jgi:aspartyl-tRNA(Asn)/glutamyl-tRNA(Gln) amidotransferase subunit A
MKTNTLTLTEVIEGLQKKTFSSVEVTQDCLDSINKTNSQLNAFVTINEQAFKDAQLADEQRAKGDTTPMLGVPIAVKDNCLTKGMRTTASSKVLDNFVPPFDATVITKVKQAGTVILGKTNMDAWAHGSSTETSDYGTSKNPWNTNHSPGGSSGGSAAAVAADNCTIAIGTETAGSIRQPAAWCGVTGLKPTYGRVSRYGVVAMASSTDQPGPIAKNVKDAALLLQILAGTDPFDGTTIKTPFSLDSNVFTSSVKGMKIGLPTQYMLSTMDKRVINIIKDAANVFEKLGASVEEMSLLDPKYSIGVYTILQRSEVSSNLARFDGIRYGNDRSFFGEEAKKRMMLGTYSLSTGYYDEYYKKAQRVRTLIVEDFQKAFSKYDLILGAVSPGPALKTGASKDQPMFGEMEDVLVEASSIAGLTSLSVPCGFVDGLPIGLQITGPQQGENTIIKAGYAYQQTTDWHTKKPEIK